MSSMQEYVKKFLEENIDKMEKFHPSDLEVITISRTTGCGARDISDKLAKDLGYTVWDSEIMAQIFDSIKLSKSKLHLVDERAFSNYKNFAGDAFSFNCMNNFTYMKELTKILYNICLDNKAIIIGRGANFLIKDALHVRLDADINKRIPKIAADLKSSRIIAKDYILKTDKKRTDFINKCFGKDTVRNFRYDLTIDTDNFSYDDVCEIIKVAMELHKKNLKKQYID